MQGSFFLTYIMYTQMENWNWWNYFILILAVLIFHTLTASRVFQLHAFLQKIFKVYNFYSFTTKNIDNQ